MDKAAVLEATRGLPFQFGCCPLRSCLSGRAMPITIEQWIRRRASAAIANGFGEWADGPVTVVGNPICRFTDGPVTLVFSALGFAYQGPPHAFESRYDQVDDLSLAPLRDLIPIEGDLLPRVDGTRLLTISAIRSGANQRVEMQFSLRMYNLVASVLPRIVIELSRTKSSED